MTTTFSNTFSCFIIGGGTLPIQCAEILVDRGHTIYGMISSDQAVIDWAREREIPDIDPKEEDIVAFLGQHPFDYLFSIVNPYILPKLVLALPRRCAINYHDAPLPKYAGSYATSWAILHGERVHAITWHAMTELVDAGDIFKQPLFEIDDRETALTLNAKCYGAAISSFAELIDDLACDRVSAWKQNLNERTFFARNKRPSPGCILSWHRSARDIGALVRALDFGSYPNPIGLPKLAIGMDFIIVSQIEVRNSMSAVPPGTVTHIDPGLVRVSAIDGEIALRKLLTIDGQPLPIADFVAKFGLYEGYQFKELDQETATRITAFNASICQHEAFWIKQLETLERITLPNVHRKAPCIQTERYLHVPIPIAGEIIPLLENRHTSWPLEDFLLAASVAYLARISGVWSFAIGYRDSELESDVADLEGMFAAFVPVHVMMEDKQSFEEVLHVVHKQVKRAKQRKTYARDIMARYPVLRSKANELEAHLPLICVERVEAVHDYKVPHGSELTLVIQEDGGACLWVYNAEMFEEESIVGLQHGFTTFLQGVVSHPQQFISNLPLLTKDEQHRLLVEWNATETPYPKDKCIHQLFEAQAERTPDAVAVVFEQERLTYQELNRKANQLASYLQHQGVGPEVLVGLCFERSLEMVIGLLGILKAGGAYVPMDPTYPKERLTFMLEDSQMVVLLTSEKLPPLLPEHQLHTVCLDSAWSTVAQEPAENLVGPVTSENLAYVIYTSGSTGMPKGVLVSHQNLVHSTVARTTYYEEPVNCFLLLSSFAFDSSVAGIFWTLCQGGVLVLPRADFQFEVSYLTKLIAQNQVSHLLCLPALYMLLLEQAKLQQMASLHTIIVAGESCPRELVECHYHLLSQAQLFNEYGPTEGTVWCSVYYCRPENLQLPVPIGRPIANMQIYLLDTQLQLVPIGVPGELYIGGAGLARGYLNHPELTNAKFIPHPFSNEPGARLYKTGDLARYLPDGNIEFLGRVDHQVKIRGFRIELGEIEKVLRQHPDVQEAVVVAREDTSGDRRLVAYIVAAQRQPLTINDLRSFLKEKLPDYMLPSAFMLLDTLPLTPNGKVDRRILSAPEPTRATTEESFVAPTLMVHYQLIQIWEDLLAVRPIGIRDNFFDLGGHSLLAARMVNRIEQVCGKKIPLSTLFAGATIEHLAQALQEKEDTGTRAPLVAVHAGGSKRPFFFLHGEWAGGAFYSRELARALGPDQPFYVLEPYQFDGLQVPPTFEAIAAIHIKTLQSVQPEGPYLLGGWCNGGLVAYEMARQLHDQGQIVDLLVLMDSAAPAQGWKWDRRIINGLSNLLRLSQEKQVDWFLSYRYWRLAFHYWRLNKLKHMRSTKQGKPELERSTVDDIPAQLDAVIPRKEALRQDWEGIYDWVVAGYMPHSYPGKITFFWTEEEPLRREGWRQLIEAKTKANEVDIHIIPGNHITSRTQYLPVLAEHLCTCINRAQLTLSSQQCSIPCFSRKSYSESKHLRSNGEEHHHENHTNRKDTREGRYILS